MTYMLSQEEYDALKNAAVGERRKAFREVLQYLSDNVKTCRDTRFSAEDVREPVISPRQLQGVIADAREKFIEKTKP